jgi:Fe-S-cluster containining protein
MEESIKESADPACLRCGRCCRDPFSRYVSPEEVARWKEEKRTDILAAIEEEQRCWEEEQGLAGLSRFKPCRFNKPMGDGGRTVCLIYETRPRVCREFIPGRSRFCSARK